VYFTTKAGGGMFSSSSIAWCGSLLENDCENNVSRMTENVLRRFMDEAPLPDLTASPSPSETSISG
jgi:N,N-dimethylformamidase